MVCVCCCESATQTSWHAAWGRWLGSPTFLHSVLWGRPQGQLPQPTLAWIQFSQDLQGQDSRSSLFLTPSFWLQGFQGCCCITGPNPLILEVKKLSPKVGQGLAQVVQQVPASVSIRIQVPGSFLLNSYCLFLWQRPVLDFPHWTVPHFLGIPSLFCCWRSGLTSYSVMPFTNRKFLLAMQCWALLCMRT